MEHPLMDTRGGATTVGPLKPVSRPLSRPPTVQVAPARFVTIELAAAITGLTPGAIRTKIGKGVWVEGREYARREGRVFVDLRGYERWVQGGA